MTQLTATSHNGRSVWLSIGALLGWFALITQFWLMMQNRQTGVPEMVVRLFSYFSILTNLIVAISFTALLTGKPSRAFAFFSRAHVSSAICAYILFVGISYQVLLRHIWQPTGMQWVVDEMLHTVIPLFVLLYWWIHAPKSGLTIRHLTSWLIYPLVYFICILLRGSLSGFYPYYFVDVSVLGYREALINSAVMLLAFMGLSLLLIRLAGMIHKRTERNAVNS